MIEVLTTVMPELTSQRRGRVGDAYPCEYCGAPVGEPCVEICERTDAGVAARRHGIDDVLEGLLAAIDTAHEELSHLEEQSDDQPLRRPRDPEDLLWAAQRTALAASELGHLVARLGDHAEQWADRISSDTELATLGISRDSAAAYLDCVRELPDQLHAAARALELAARRGTLAELRWCRP